MSELDPEELTTLAKRCLVLAMSSVARRSVDAVEQTATLARKLFPPMAKPLAWVFTFDGERAALSSGLTRYEIYQHAATGFNVRFMTDETTVQLTADFYGAKYADLDAAKTACEAHHQSRFLEQLA